MATTVVLYNGTGYWLNLLDTAAHTIREGASLGLPTIERAFARPYGRGFDPLGSYRAGNRKLELPLTLYGTSVDNLIVNSQQVKAVLDQARRFHGGQGGSPAYLAVQPHNATNTTIFDVLDGELNDGGAIATDRALTASTPYIREALLRLTLHPYGRTQQLRKNTSATLNNGGGTGASGGTYTLTKPTSGEIASPMRVEVQTAAGDVGRRFILAKVARGDVADIAAYFILQCEEGSFTGYTVTDIEADADFSAASTAVAAASGGNVERVTSSAACTHTGNLLRWELTGPLASLRGRYDVWLRVDHPAQAGAGAAHKWRLRYGGSDGLLISNDQVTVDTGTVDQMIYMGQIEIPTPGAGLGAVLNSFFLVLEYTHAFAAGSQAYDLDNLYLVPAGRGVELLDAEFNANTTAQDILIVDGLAWQPDTYLIASGGGMSLLQRSTPWIDQGFWRGVDGDALFLPLVLRKSGSVYTLDLTDQLTIVTYDYPRFGLFDA